MHPTTKLSLILLGAALLAACDKVAAPKQPRAEPAAAAQPAAAPVAPAAPAAPAANGQAALGVEDIDRWQRGMGAERKAVQEAAVKLAAARDDKAKSEALLAATDMGTAQAGASAAGLDPDRYRLVGTTFSAAVGQLSPLEMEMDVSQMPPEMIEQMKQGRAAGAERIGKELSPAVMQALRARAADLRRQDLELAAERLKAAETSR